MFKKIISILIIFIFVTTSLYMEKGFALAPTSVFSGGQEQKKNLKEMIDWVRKQAAEITDEETDADKRPIVRGAAAIVAVGLPFVDYSRLFDEEETVDLPVSPRLLESPAPLSVSELSTVKEVPESPTLSLSVAPSESETLGSPAQTELSTPSSSSSEMSAEERALDREVKEKLIRYTEAIKFYIDCVKKGDAAFEIAAFRAVEAAYKEAAEAAYKLDEIAYKNADTVKYKVAIDTTNTALVAIAIIAAMSQIRDAIDFAVAADFAAAAEAASKAAEAASKVKAPGVVIAASRATAAFINANSKEGFENLELFLDRFKELLASTSPGTLSPAPSSSVSELSTVIEVPGSPTSLSSSTSTELTANEKWLELNSEAKEKLIKYIKANKKYLRGVKAGDDDLDADFEKVTAAHGAAAAVADAADDEAKANNIISIINAIEAARGAVEAARAAGNVDDAAAREAIDLTEEVVDEMTYVADTYASKSNDAVAAAFNFVTKIVTEAAVEFRKNKFTEGIQKLEVFLNKLEELLGSEPLSPESPSPLPLKPGLVIPESPELEMLSGLSPLSFGLQLSEIDLSAVASPVLANSLSPVDFNQAARDAEESTFDPMNEIRVSRNADGLIRQITIGAQTYARIEEIQNGPARNLVMAFMELNAKGVLTQLEYTYHLYDNTPSLGRFIKETDIIEINKNLVGASYEITKARLLEVLIKENLRILQKNKPEVLAEKINALEGSTEQVTSEEVAANTSRVQALIRLLSYQIFEEQLGKEMWGAYRDAIEHLYRTNILMAETVVTMPDGSTRAVDFHANDSDITGELVKGGVKSLIGVFKDRIIADTELRMAA